jgi:hypothetical protein
MHAFHRVETASVLVGSFVEINASLEAERSHREPQGLMFTGRHPNLVLKIPKVDVQEVRKGGVGLVRLCASGCVTCGWDSARRVVKYREQE